MIDRQSGYKIHGLRDREISSRSWTAGLRDREISSRYWTAVVLVKSKRFVIVRFSRGDFMEIVLSKAIKDTPAESIQLFHKREQGLSI